MVAENNKEDVFNRLVGVVETVLQTAREKDLRQRPNIQMSTDLYEELEIDSLEVMDIIAAIDEEFSIELNPEEVGKKQTMGDMVDYISEKLA